MNQQSKETSTSLNKKETHDKQNIFYSTPGEIGSQVQGESMYPNNVKKGNLFSDLDLAMADMEPIHFTVDGLIPHGLIVFVAPPKTGKSIAVMNIAQAVANGNSYLGHNTKQGVVICLCLEDGKNRLATRLKKSGYPRSENLLISTTIGEEEPLKYVEDLIKKHPKTVLLQIDTYGKLTGNSNGRSNFTKEYSLANKLKALADKHELTILVVHHTVKKIPDDWVSGIYGTYGLTAAADAIYYLERKRGSENAVLHGTGRDIEDFSIPLKLNKDFCRWELREDNTPPIKLNPERTELYDILNNSENPMQLKDIAERVGKSTKNVNNQLAKMIESGVVEKASTGCYQIRKDIVENTMDSMETVDHNIEKPMDSVDGMDS